jgi:hypothetical protein
MLINENLLDWLETRDMVYTASILRWGEGGGHNVASAV